MIVDFFICGVQKGGTTALDSFLRGHPELQMAKVKETHFFDNESFDWSAPPYRKLHDFFDPAPARRRGETTPIYTYWPNAMERLCAYNPDAKLILMLRHPVLRALSHWRMETTRGAETLSFSEAIRPAAGERVRTAPGGVHRVFSYVERGFYAPQIERIRGLFSDDQLLILRADALWNNPAATLRQIQSFLEVTPLLAKKRRYVVPVNSDKSVPLAPDDALYLAALYANDIRRTQSLTGLDLQDWLDPTSAFAEPMRP
jgi:Sulfotransferase domain